MKRRPIDPSLENDSLVQRMRQTVSQLAYSKPESVVTPINDAPERTRQTIKLLARRRISEVLRQLRAAHGYSYEDIQLETGLSQQTLFDLEFKDRRLTLAELRLLAACFDVSVADILGVEVD